MGDANEIWWVRACFNSGGSNEFMHVSSSAGCGNYVYVSRDEYGFTQILIEKEVDYYYICVY
jgi:hypothetical protein